MSGMRPKDMAAGLAMAVYAAIAVAVTASGIHVRCEADHECNKNEYCYTSGYCVQCTDCAFYKRKNRTSYPNCAKEPLQCGECLPGFEEESLTGTDVRDFCIHVTSPDANDSPASLVHIYIILGILAVIIFCSFFGAVLFLIRRRLLKGRTQHVEECNVQGTENIPMYSEPLLDLTSTGEMPVATKSATDDLSVEICETSLKIFGEKESVQQAVPFTNVDISYNFLEELGDASGDYPPAIHDEETLEIVWVPPPGYGQQGSMHDSDNSNNETEANASANEVRDSDQTANPAISVNDSGLSPNSSFRNSSVRLSLRPFEGVGLSSPSSLSFQQPLTTTRARSLSDEDASSGAREAKRARLDSCSQSLDEDALPVNVVVINVHQCATAIHK